MIEAAKRNSQSSPAGEWDSRFGFGRIDGVETLKEFLTTDVQGTEHPAPARISDPAVPESIAPPANGNGTHGNAESYIKALIAALQTSTFHLTVEPKPN
jgi:hypothetical protein